jgi:Lrp/AsnC family transcriptional regulator for asnA, asnC and gidA
MSILDSLDKRLISLLGQDARQRSEKLAEQLGVSPATIRRRLRKLLKSDVLNIIAVVDPAKIGMSIQVVMAIDVERDKINATMASLVKKPEVKWVSTTTGRFDIIAIGRFDSNDELASFLANELSRIEGLRDVETLVCLDVQKGRYIVL